MPIYAYRCESCGHAKDVLQKMSDSPLTICPACGAESMRKQVTAAGFQLKGSGWYVTDFRDGAKGGTKAAPAEGVAESAPGAAPDGSADKPPVKGEDASKTAAVPGKVESSAGKTDAPAGKSAAVPAPLAAPASGGGSAGA